MARYYFHLWSGLRVEVDDHGVEFSDLGAAYLDAFAAARAMTSDLEKMGRDPCFHYFDIVDRHGHKLLDVRFAEVIAFDAGAKVPVFRKAEQVARTGLRNDLAQAVSAAKATIAFSRQVIARSRTQTELALQRPL